VTLPGPWSALAGREGDQGEDAPTLRAQLGRDVRGPWAVAARCSFGHPTVIAVGPMLDDGTPFPTTLWLSCPWLTAAVSDLESAGAGTMWAARIADDPALAEQVAAADERYRSARAASCVGTDPCAGVGVAGQTDPLAVKCLHARAAAEAGGLGDPVGAGVLAALAAREDGALECPDDRCRLALAGPDVAPPG
jgi:hypothetical protein